jgi:hypothetical protein
MLLKALVKRISRPTPVLGPRSSRFSINVEHNEERMLTRHPSVFDRVFEVRPTRCVPWKAIHQNSYIARRRTDAEQALLDVLWREVKRRQRVLPNVGRESGDVFSGEGGLDQGSWAGWVRRDELAELVAEREVFEVVVRGQGGAESAFA